MWHRNAMPGIVVHYFGLW